MPEADATPIETGRIEDEIGLFTDLYELRMARAYLALGMTAHATFSLAVRRLPPTRNVLLAAGIDDVADLIAGLRFGPAAIGYLRGLGEFCDEFLDWLAGFRFSGDLDAVAEGTPLFGEEPLLEITAPIAEAQILETLVMNQAGLQTLLASKALRVVSAAAGRTVVDFGARRAQGTDAALAGARAFHIAGVAGTSNVLAGARHGIPLVGTMAHSFVQAFPDEASAFRAFAALHPATTLLVDTYDTLGGVRRVADLARALGPACRIQGVRLDSGDLGALAAGARAILDAAGLTEMRIFASGGLDEHRIAALVAAGAPIDAFGVGTDMSVSADAPALDIAYKLAAYAGTPRTKLSPGKRVLPGRKQVFRQPGGDVIARADERLPGVKLLRPVLRGGARVLPRASLAEARATAQAGLAALPAALCGLAPAPYAVSVSPALLADLAALRRAHGVEG
jgi:nicotinate phosphoribosyltransferase